jgi:hypothetical protein
MIWGPTCGRDSHGHPPDRRFVAQSLFLTQELRLEAKPRSYWIELEQVSPFRVADRLGEEGSSLILSLTSQIQERNLPLRRRKIRTATPIWRSHNVRVKVMFEGRIE